MKSALDLRSEHTTNGLGGTDYANYWQYSEEWMGLEL